MRRVAELNKQKTKKHNKTKKPKRLVKFLSRSSRVKAFPRSNLNGHPLVFIYSEINILMWLNMVVIKFFFILCVITMFLPKLLVYLLRCYMLLGNGRSWNVEKKISKFNSFFFLSTDVRTCHKCPNPGGKGQEKWRREEKRDNSIHASYTIHTSMFYTSLI